LGTGTIHLTRRGREDAVFGYLPERFLAHIGHQDTVDSLPQDAELLASTDLVTNQAFRILHKPIYCTQFHPELTRATFLERVMAYPEYVEKIAGIPFEQFAADCTEAPESGRLLRKCVEHFFG
jgi:GMP synthase (glutamine-hydrolysing)